ncbi:holo-ACP synthase [Cutibacterium sp. WCA-380-WT-3A]|uniref:Holo-[acyl-carrier-protein] synthase n=1 Tax=Cutibacterium porci TaxID=2605781 RepID=A0A7K0J8G2_9ACTN|nr:holo-ACP synthase [Cutibacterium porci]MSS46048.1 holo-ACP synthase [Cutibacterium porci]
MIIGIGVDVCDISRWEAAIQRRPGIARKVLTDAEAALPAHSQAARFAAKEALYKALSGVGGLSWQDCEVVTDGTAVKFELRGSLARRAKELGVRTVHLSLTHDAGVAVAMVVCEG